MIIGTSSYSFHQYAIRGEMTQVDCIKKAKELGFEAIEFTELRTPEGIGELEYADVLRKTADGYLTIKNNEKIINTQ